MYAVVDTCAATATLNLVRYETHRNDQNTMHAENNARLGTQSDTEHTGKMVIACSKSSHGAATHEPCQLRSRCGPESDKHQARLPSAAPLGS